MELVTSDAHQGLMNAIAAVFAGASWQLANLLTRVPKRAQPGVATMVRTIYQQLSPAEVHGQLDRWWNNSGRPLPGTDVAGLHGLPSGGRSSVQQPAG